MRKTDRTFYLGSSWIYVKLYMPETEANRILLTTIHSLAKKLKKEKLIDKWFFIRYYDPEFHFRFRCHLLDTSKFQKVIELVNLKIENEVRKGTIYKTTYDTYIREFDRYGETTMEFSEDMFQMSSEQTIILNKLFAKHGGGFIVQAVFPIFIIDNFLNNFGYSIESKQRLSESLWKSFSDEFNYTSEHIRLLSKKYREFKPILNSIMKKEICVKQIAYTERTNATIRKKMAKYHLANGAFNSNKIASFIHMMLNRYFNFAQRAHELVLYYSLFNYYRSEIKRMENTLKNNKVTV